MSAGEYRHRPSYESSMTSKSDLRRTIKPVYLLVIIMGLALLVTLELAETVTSWRSGVYSGQPMYAYNGNTGLMESNREVDVRQHASQTPELGMDTSTYGRRQGTPSNDDDIDLSPKRRKYANKDMLSGINQANEINSHIATGREGQISRVQQGNVMDSRIGERGQGMPSFTDLMSRERSNTSVYNALHSLERERFLQNYYLRARRDEQTEREYKESHVVFIHVFKCGGTTMKDALSKIAIREKLKVHTMSTKTDVNKIYKCFSQGSTDSSGCGSLNVHGDDSRRRIIMGSFTFGVCDSLRGRPCSYYSVIREPVDRIVSSYLFCREDVNHCAGDVQGVSITDWALRKGSLFFNLLTRSEFASTQMGKQSVKKTIENKEIKRSVLDYFLQNLENWFTFIGITEEMDMSMSMFEDVYGLPVERAPMMNQGRTKSRMDQQRLDNMKETLRSNATVMEALYEDIMLYRKGKDIFQEQVKQFNKTKTLL